MWNLLNCSFAIDNIFFEWLNKIIERLSFRTDYQFKDEFFKAITELFYAITVILLKMKKFRHTRRIFLILHIENCMMICSNRDFDKKSNIWHTAQFLKIFHIFLYRKIKNWAVCHGFDFLLKSRLLQINIQLLINFNLR